MFQIQPLSVAQFLPLFGVSDDVLKAHGIRAQIADKAPGFPCRVSLRDAEPGERVLLLNCEHQPADVPFRASVDYLHVHHARFGCYAAKVVRA